MALKLKWHFLLKLLLPISVGMIACVLVTIIYLSQESDKWTDSIGNSMQDRTFDYVRTKLASKSSNVEMYFTKILSDYWMLSNYSVDLFSGDLSVKHFYPNYFVVDTIDPNAPVLVNGINTKNSGWFKQGVTSVNNYQNQNVNQTTTLNNAWRSVYSSDNKYLALFIGMNNDGIFRQYPYSRLNNFPTMKYTCESTKSTVTGFDPRCRIWYTTAISANEPILSRPYSDASTGNVIITVSKSININGNFIGVIGGDISISNLNQNILSSTIMTNGFSFVIDGTGNVVIYPEADTSQLQQIQNLLLTNPGERTAFNSHLTTLLNNNEGEIIYQKDGGKWYLFFRKISDTPYILGMTVPENDILKASKDLKSKISKLSGGYMGVTIAILLVAIAFFAYLNYKLSDNITAPLTELIAIMEKMTKANLNVEMENIAPQSVELQTLYSQFGNLIHALRFGNEAYYRGDLKKALNNYVSVYNIMRETGNMRGIGVCMNNMANVYMHSDPNKAKQLYEDSIQNAKDLLLENPDPAHQIVLAKRYMNYGVFFKEKMKDTGNAYRQYEESLRIHKDVGNDIGIARVCGNIGQLYLITNQTKDAEEYIQSGWNTVEKSGVDDAKQYGAMNMGILAKHKNDHNCAIAWFTHVLTTYPTLIDNVKKACVSNLLELYQTTGRNDIKQHIESLTQTYIVAPKNVYFVLDKSGSMAGAPLQICKDSIKHIIRNNTNDCDSVSLVSFDDRVTTEFGLMQKQNNIYTMERSVDNVRVGGRTAFYDALNSVITSDSHHNNGNGTWIIALTDGADNGSNRNSFGNVTHALKNTQKDINVIIITVGRLDNINQIRQICKSSKKGKHIEANNINEIEMSFVQAAQFMTSEVEVEKF